MHIDETLSEYNDKLIMRVIANHFKINYVISKRLEVESISGEFNLELSEIIGTGNIYASKLLSAFCTNKLNSKNFHMFDEQALRDVISNAGIIAAFDGIKKEALDEEAGKIIQETFIEAMTNIDRIFEIADMTQVKPVD